MFLPNNFYIFVSMLQGLIIFGIFSFVLYWVDKLIDKISKK